MEEKKTRRPADIVKAEKIANIEKAISYHRSCITSLEAKLEAIKNKYISKVDLTLTIPKAGQTVEDNIFAVTSKYDNIVIRVKEWIICRVCWNESLFRIERINSMSKKCRTLKFI